MIYVVDTHALVWFFENSDELGKNAKNAFDSEEDVRLITKDKEITNSKIITTLW